MRSSEKFVEVGRLVQITRGAFKNKAALIVNVIDQNHVLVQNPECRIPRVMINLKSLKLTDLKTDITRGASSKAVRAAFKKDDLNTKYSSGPISRKLGVAQAKRESTDFERHELRRVRRVRSNLAKKEN
mmetsp:Transcript_34818/g.47611  ORF Transcript_34818/g.47611 Transcript_34818/m.47611 type:complete len:129 (+) Transcript_34818:61-447(+)|eukprot:CAMPEP_0201478160 /NCGR_PEP_ID=MMETSP0151_2-20130828/3076_1 /ASSEMBLY_ACC=CAM_ASM_000257 /TAXON_ID=200890 /ORGANISM="Paramoeba atlantica, Strain 621/1 / CCAP 1560/9" /LENGTH=128 /DNA_ID=CAMNT_0047859159 /DNA_START=60 /DNA_END=446 /DNA_ORIENTATION=-